MIDLSNLTYTERRGDNGVKSICAGVTVKHTICVHEDWPKELEELAKKHIRDALYLRLYGDLRGRLRELRHSVSLTCDNVLYREDIIKEFDEILAMLYPPKDDHENHTGSVHDCGDSRSLPIDRPPRHTDAEAGVACQHD